MMIGGTTCKKNPDDRDKVGNVGDVDKAGAALSIYVRESVTRPSTKKQRVVEPTDDAVFLPPCKSQDDDIMSIGER